MKVLILSVDRDNDLGRKASIEGPVIGEEAVERAAIKLLRSDPSETDANAIFAALKLYDELEGEKEIAVLTGSQRVGFHSDIRIKKQLEEVLSKFKADGVILVSDGKEDEMIAPVIESLVPIISIHRIVVHSGQELKGFYYGILNFLKRSAEDPELAKVVFGVPGFIALVYALLGPSSWRILAGVLGIYLVIQGAGLSDMVSRFAGYVKNSFFSMSISFFLYLLSFILAVIGSVKALSVKAITTRELIAKIVYSSSLPFLYSGLLFILGLVIDSWPDKRKVIQLLGIGVSFGVTLLVLRSLSLWVIEPTYPLSYIITTAILGSVVVLLMKLLLKVTEKE